MKKQGAFVQRRVGGIVTGLALFVLLLNVILLFQNVSISFSATNDNENEDVLVNESVPESKPAKLNTRTKEDVDVMIVLKKLRNHFPTGSYTEPPEYLGLVGSKNLNKMFQIVAEYYPEGHVPREVKLLLADALWLGQKEQVFHGWCNHNNPERPFEYWDQYYNFFPPTVGCETMVRPGIPADGGKYLCNFQKILRKDKTCLVYSMGSSSEITFDQDMINLFGCEVHSFDHSVRKDSPHLMENHHFWCLGPVAEFKSGSGAWSLNRHECKGLDSIVKELGHTEVDVLKIDVEGSEKWFLRYIDEQLGTNYLSQQLGVKIVMLEVHAPRFPHTQALSNCGELAHVVEIIDILHKSGYYMYSQESNLRWAGGIEFGFVHRDYV